MKKTKIHTGFQVVLLAAVLPALGADSGSPDASPTLREAFKDDFRIGAAVNRSIAAGAAAVRAGAFRRSPEDVEKDRALVVEQFDHVVPENDLKWALIHPREGADGYNWEPADAFVDFGETHDMYIAGHTLVWHAQTPRWVFAGTNPPPASAEAPAPGGGRRFGFSGPRASREELLARMRDHIHAVVGRYKGRIHAWDVVNEAISDRGSDVLRNSPWLEIIGPDFIAKAFAYAHEADPDAILRYNDYGLENPEKRAKLMTLVKSLQEQGVPVMAIGSQTHVSAASPSFEEMDRALAEMKSLGLPIHITELDVNTASRGQRSFSADITDNAGATGGGIVENAEQRQAEQYANLFRAFRKHRDAVKVVAFWGANDAVSWRANGRPLLFDGDNQPKPAFDAVLRVAAEQDPTTVNSSE
jgi:endo-1,4-beta-xylanase